ncbi:MAG: FecR domain-containing protein [Candidatus Eremiobacteraeota bacterium]|nr:FecR domain-containing protein [Candidatus Eremiobacteraeota bacterium]
MTSKWFTSLLSGCALIGVTLTNALPASAEQAPENTGPGVARVSVVQGSAVVQRGDSNKQVAAVVNAPLLPGDYISTGATSRGELQFDGATAVRLGGNVQARITNNDRNNRQLQLADGTIEVGLVRDGDAIAIDTPSITVRSARDGDYRISIGRDSSTWVTTRRGSAEVVTPQRTYTLEPGRTLVARGSASDPAITYTSEVAFDSFDDFAAKRDRTMIAALNASPNLNPDIAGYDNLGAYGQWQNVAGYGQAWVPQQSANWSPYGKGSWTWEGGYGWTWVANEPWGWAPYHYGRWFYANGYGWAWAPPAYSAYPAWSPALVGFFGFGVGLGGPGWGVSLGFGSGGYGYGYGGFGYPYLGWYPLPPYAPYYPWYPGWAWTGFGWGWGGGCCGWGTRIVNVTHVTNIYRYFPHGGVHGVTVGNFQHGTISGHTFTLNAHNITNHVGMIHGAVPIAPTRDNLGFGGGTLHAPVTLSKAFDTPRFTANRALAARTPFDEQQKAVSRAITGNPGRDNAPVSRENSVTARHDGAPTDSWQRFNQARGAGEHGTALASHPDRAEAGGERTSSETGRSFADESSRETRAPSDSWSRFSAQRGNVSAGSYSERGSYSRGGSYGESYSRGSAEGSRSYGSSYPSYSRASSQSYSRNAYPSSSRSSYPSYARGSYQSAPSYSHGGGGYSAPAHPSGGGGSTPRGGGGGGNPHGGGRPPS